MAGAAEDNAAARRAGDLGSVGLVVGATIGDAARDLDLRSMGGPLLAPGVGAQGGTAESLRQVFGGALPQVLPSSSREVLSAGPDVRSLRDAVHRTGQQMRALVTPSD